MTALFFAGAVAHEAGAFQLLQGSGGRFELFLFVGFLDRCPGKQTLPVELSEAPISEIGEELPYLYLCTVGQNVLSAIPNMATHCIFNFSQATVRSICLRHSC